MDNIEVTLYSNLIDKQGLCIALNRVFERIIYGNSKSTIKAIRKADSKEDKSFLKKKLSAVAFGGSYTDRTTLKRASGLACLDFDHVNNLNELKNKLKNSDFIYAYWLSPSGNGIKALVRIPIIASKETYKKYYLGILEHFKSLNPDHCTKDMNRLCFESYDPNLYINKRSEVFTKKFKTPVYNTKAKYNQSDLPEGKIIDRVLKWWIKNFGFKEGQRNNNVFILASSLCEFGITKTTTIYLLSSFISVDFSESEVQRITKSAYSRSQFNSKSFTH